MPVAGLTGAATGTVFGLGAPAYAIYLARTLEDKLALRATLSTMVLFSTPTRALVVAARGLMLVDRLIMRSILLPFALLELWFGNRLQGGISREPLARVHERPSVVDRRVGAGALLQSRI